MNQSVTTSSKQAGNPVSSQPALTLHQFDAAQALQRGELSVSVSELLGCDYVFVEHPAKTMLVHERHLAHTLNQLLEMLELAPKQKIFIGVHEDAQGEQRFYRFICEWQFSTATKVCRELITQNEQCDFMKMIFDCSSPCVLAAR